jgi:hypothetical protein
MSPEIQTEQESELRVLHRLCDAHTAMGGHTLTGDERLA